LLFILRAAEHEPALASLNRVIIGEKAANRGLKSSERTLKEAWKKYTPVAHLWAAANSVASEEFRASGLEPAKLRMFLAYAEYLRRRGEAWTHPHGREPLLDPNETWKVPPDFALPKVSIKVGPLSAADVRLATGAK
jgi:hypothetical protein